MPAGDVAGPYVHLADTGTLAYAVAGHSFTFDPLYKSKLTGKPRYDEAGRVITCWEYTLRVEAKVTSGAPSSTGTSTNATMQAFQQTLMQPAGYLVYQSKGWDFAVNGGPAPFGGGYSPAGATSYDVMWGPKPNLISFRPEGNANQAVVEWEVTWAQPQCVCTPIYKNAPMAINYDQEWSFDDEGYLQLAISGYLEIPLTRKTQGDHTLPDDADKYRDRIYPDIPLQMEWKSRKFKLSKDRRRLDFNLLMGQLYAPKPVGAIKAEAEHGLDTNLKEGLFCQWHGSLDATFTVPPGVTKQTTYNMWILLQQRQFGTAFQLLFGSAGGAAAGAAAAVGAAAGGALAAAAGAAAANQPTFLVDSWGLREAVFGNRVSYRCAYRIMGATLEWILLKSGLWAPVPGTDFGTWKQSLAVPWSSRGQSGAKFDDNADALVDLCLCAKTNSTLRPGTLNGTNTLKTGPLPGTGSTTVNTSATWLAYINRLEVYTRQGLAVHKPLVAPQDLQLKAVKLESTFASSPGLGGSGGTQDGGFPGLPGGGAKLINEIKDIPQAQGTLQNLPTGGTPDTLQRIGQESYRVRMRGFGARFGVRVPDPELISVGGQPATREQRWSAEWEEGGVYGVPCFWTCWDKVYVLAASPGPFGVLPNPIYG